MAQLLATVNTEEEVPEVTKVSMSVFGNSLPSEQASVPPLTVPAVKEGVPMAIAVLEPSDPASR